MSVLRPVGFLHIPKTAGMSVRAALLAHYPAEAVGPVRYDDRLFGPFTGYDTFAPALRAETLLPTDPAPVAPAHLLQLGHLSLQGLERLLPAARICTVLREPRARLLSHHLYWAVRPVEQNEAFGEYQVQRHAQHGLRAFLEADGAAHQHDNLLCRMLVDAPTLIPTDRPIDQAHHAEVAAMAIAAVGSLGLVTLVEDPTMWARIGEFVGHPLQAVRTNVTEAADAPVHFHGPQLDPDTVALVNDRNGADLLLYHSVVASTFGCSAADAAAFADRHFVSQAERYGRVTAAVVSRTPVQPPATQPEATTSPSAPSARTPHRARRRRFGRFRT